MEGKNGAIISTREKGEPARHSPPWWSASVLSDFAAPALLPNYASSEHQEGHAMNDIELSQIRVELTRLFEEQVEFFRKRSLAELAPVEHYKYEKRREHIRQLFAELSGMRKVA